MIYKRDQLHIKELLSFNNILPDKYFLKWTVEEVLHNHKYLSISFRLHQNTYQISI